MCKVAKRARRGAVFALPIVAGSVDSANVGMIGKKTLDFGQFDFGRFDFGQLAEIELAEVELAEVVHVLACLLCVVFVRLLVLVWVSWLVWAGFTCGCPCQIRVYAQRDRRNFRQIKQKCHTTRVGNRWNQDHCRLCGKNWDG